MGLGYLPGMACWIIPAISVAIRRLHDIGKSGLWVFLVQIPVPVVLLVTLLVFGMPNVRGLAPVADRGLIKTYRVGMRRDRRSVAND